ncbi:MAG: TIGR01777 family oxidoreductase [Syntrophobacteraceae bacterium]
MRVFMTGGTGFVGSYVSRKLAGAGHEVTVLSRSKKPEAASPERIRRVGGDPMQSGSWQEELPGHDVVINLAGSSIFTRWTPQAKQMLLDSRVRTTRNVVDALSRVEPKPILISCSAVGYYGGHEDDRILDESSPPGDDFLSQVGTVWEAEARRAEEYGARVVLTRFGIVLGKGGGALAQMAPAFRYALGSPLGSGRQWFSWIHMEDLLRILLFVIEKPGFKGPVNCTAPNPVRNAELVKVLAKAVHRWAFLPAVPAFAMRLVAGELADLVLKGQRVVPKRLTEEGFQFQYPHLREALEDLLE